jgi:hypothetical protein
MTVDVAEARALAATAAAAAPKLAFMVRRGGGESGAEGGAPRLRGPARVARAPARGRRSLGARSLVHPLFHAKFDWH